MEEYYCPRCRTRTLRRDGEYLTCGKCGFTVWVGILELKSNCITVEDLDKRLPLSLRRKIIRLLRKGKLKFVKKFDITNGREVLCIEPTSLNDNYTLEFLKQVEILLNSK